MPARSVCVSALGLALGLATLPGCGRSQVVVQAKLEPSHLNLMSIGSAYVRFNGQHKRPPRDAEELKGVLKEFGNPDEILRSPRDGLPYVICWGVDVLAPTPWATSTPVLAYEKLGRDGSRYVLSTLRSVSVMTDADFEQASFPPGHRR